MRSEQALPHAFLNLNGDWQFRQADDPRWHPATVPGCNFTDLLANGLIEDPFQRDNEAQLQWIEKCDWHYRREFEVTAAMLALDEVELVFEGLDTFCDIYINGHLLGRGQNMFVGQRLVCKDQLRPGNNLLEVRFDSPLRQVLPLHQHAGFTYPAENDKTPEKLSVFCRKAPCHFGWDWGPKFVTSGIWRDCYLQAVDKAIIRDVHFVQHQLSPETAQFSFLVSVHQLSGAAVSLAVECKQAPWLNRHEQLQNSGEHRLDFSLADPRLWWPNGLGEAALYDFRFCLLVDDRQVDVWQRSIGLRTLEVVNQPDEMGVSFYLKVNGHPIFMKGANYIPSDSFIHRVDAGRLEREFDAVQAANMNMLRVWGGGVYQDDYFYDLADKKGILIWQDFMFACTLYPADAAFLDNVRQEAEFNIRRLRNHPCLALWCGNNEVDMAIKHWQWQDKFGYDDALYTRLKQDYMALFDGCLPGKVEELDGQRFYLRSSPIAFWEEDADHLGNHHFWGVWHGEQPFSEYQKRVPRFMSEFGFQSFPMPASLARFTEPQDWQLDSPVLAVHQKHPRGNRLIQSYLEQEYPTPRDFAGLLYLSQVQQAEGLRLAFEAHRAAMPFCMGSLYWQLNDTWPAASWSGIDYYGRWKALHYQARRSFSPQLVLIMKQAESLEIKLVSDCLHLSNGRVNLTLLDFDGQILWQQEKAVIVPASQSHQVCQLDPAELVAGKDPRRLVLQARWLDPGGELLSESLYYFVPTKQQRLTKAGIELSRQIEAGRLTLDMQSDQLVRQVYLELPDVHDPQVNFSDNFFDLLPHQPRRITLALPGMSASQIETLAAQLSVQSMFDVALESQA
ncbi:beta-mannosidase [Bowmanella dokdonensis]|uniref:Beta-mannosidase B n=1 Tax=Bowmanella dokdonensis TaxID=751969 RepID=A0A939DNA9_9ALTE|nr:glycoside hydrolase family 2 protein [Bowmanella dokdonensis]MBN7825265.1 glycoside hydrolase family 2 protein [Bowmanella dokdonensis]